MEAQRDQDGEVVSMRENSLRESCGTDTGI